MFQADINIVPEESETTFLWERSSFVRNPDNLSSNLDLKRKVNWSGFGQDIRYDEILRNIDSVL